jgi:hypothetical protein
VFFHNQTLQAIASLGRSEAMTTFVLLVVETIDTRGNITRHAAKGDGSVRCGRGGTVDRNHPEPFLSTIFDRKGRRAPVVEDLHCGRCRRLVALYDIPKAAVFKRPRPRLML